MTAKIDYLNGLNLYLVVSLISIVLLTLKLWLLAKKEKLKSDELIHKLAALNALQKWNSQLESSIAAERSAHSDTQKQLNETIGVNAEKASQVETLKSQLNEENQRLKKWEEQLHQSFENLANKALKTNHQQFLDLAKTTLEKETYHAQSEMKHRHKNIENMIQPLQNILSEYKKDLSLLETNQQTIHSSLASELKKVMESTKDLQQETSALKNALKKPHIRGRWGEVQLKNCIEMAGMSEFCDVQFQDVHTLDEDKNRLIPDMTVKMPGGHIVIVDAKTPLDAFLGYLEATTDDGKQKEMIRHGKHLKTHIQKLSSKAYSDNLKHSADFTIMFLPNESFLYAALESQPNLIEYAIQKKILIATPPTLIGLLKVIRYGWNEEKLTQNAIRVSEVGKELHKRICDFTESLLAVGKSLEKADKDYKTAVSRLNSRVLVQAVRLEKLGAKSKKDLPEVEDLLFETAQPIDLNKSPNPIENNKKSLPKQSAKIAATELDV